jgi:hypothetical protein
LRDLLYVPPCIRPQARIGTVMTVSGNETRRDGYEVTRHGLVQSLKEKV